MAQAGFFITFEGSEGCGKSTQISRLAARLRGAGREVIQLREPGGTPVGERIRDLLQYDATASGMTAEAELLLFAASRAQLVREVIRPALARGVIVLCDRFLDSTTVYQGVARQLEAGQVGRINDFAVDGTLPDLTLLLDLDAAEGRRRASARKGPVDRMEQEQEVFYEAVRRGFLQLARDNPSRIKLIDGSANEESVGIAVAAAVGERLGHEIVGGDDGIH
jgi:dTMP kinase